MKILFLCGSLEPGKDGVGDYTRRLAGELVRQNNQAAIISLYDKNCDTFKTETQQADEVLLETLRIPLLTTDNNRREILRTKIKSFSPDWVSLQFVPYGYHKKGLPLGLPAMLRSLTFSFRWHIMFHELWIGKPKGFSPKQTVVRSLQKSIVRKLLSRLQPSVVHTQLPDFFLKLTNLGCCPKELMLFSNIPVHNHTPALQPDDTFVIGFFSQMAYRTEISDFLNSLCSGHVLMYKRIKIVFIGGSKEKAEWLVNQYKETLNFAPEFETTGRLMPESLSDALSACNLGITPIPRHALGKSGSLAAFLAHRTPVAAPITSEGYGESIGFFSQTLANSILTAPDLSLLGSLHASATASSELICTKVICRKFLQDLSSNN